jgi:hypothetical protein
MSPVVTDRNVPAVLRKDPRLVVSLAAAYTMFGDYAGKYGFPQAIYVDRSGIYRSDRQPTEAELLAQEQPQTQFGRAMKELRVELILARSPQAKGRVERMNRTLQTGW